MEDEYRLQMQEHRSQAAQQQAQQQAPKEEKATGGVSAKLDYDMERMTDFVCEAAQGLYALHRSQLCLADIDIIRSIPLGAPQQTPFRKWVAQVLSATRLPSATILLSLHYLTVRMREHPKSVGTSDNQIYRLLAVALILGSKFLDDNTFINRSWSDVSGIKVSELNVLEIEWLGLINYDLHCDPTDQNGLSMWLRGWKEYDERATSKARATRLSPINTSLQRQSSLRNASPYQQQYAKGPHGEFTPLSARPSSLYSAASYASADPWNRSEPTGVEAFYGNQHRYPTLDELERTSRVSAQEQARRSAYVYNLPPLQSYAPSGYVSSWGQSPWNSVHPYGCNCMSCSRQYTPYSMAPGYGVQTVAG
ncbi:cyclin-like protein [Taxawa tesnikishii (nom. ined.)]|nr:cyclin-like protein [Dothideales sp. JES 119]